MTDPSGTISVSGTYDGGMKRICCIGDGGQSESQDPVFELANGATIKNVIGGGAKSATDKLFQHNGNGTVNISGFYAENIGKLYRACGNCTNSYT
ncbi:pectate lyase, partial [Luedemannella flava]|uniref:pectate lyase n=1 Tax=Luedemannella flava TaxID=349316 RepID=UPI0031DECD65